MDALPSFFLATIVGYSLGGLRGAVIGSTIGWVVSIISNGIKEHKRSRLETTVFTIARSLEDLNEQIKVLAIDIGRARAIQSAVLDASPVANCDALDMRTPRTQEEWDIIYRDKWKLLRRRLVVSYGLQGDHVDKAQRYIMDQHITGHELPRSDQALADMVKAWKESEAWAIDVANTGPAAGTQDTP